MVKIRVFFAVLIFILNFHILSKAEDIKDFEIEGLSVGSSLLDHFSKKKIESSTVSWYDDLEKNRYTSFAFDSPNFEFYDFVDVWTEYNDKKYLIDTIAGVIYFGKNKPIEDIKDCYQKQKDIVDDLSEMFTEAKIIGPSTQKHSSDQSGKSTYTDFYLNVNSEYEIVVACYDWSKEMLESQNRADHIYVSIRSHELDNWLGN